MFAAMPTHPLLVHVPVVLIPLTTLLVALVALRSRWVPTIGPLLVVLAGGGALGAVLAAQSGDELEDRFRAAGETISPLLHDHAELGETTEVLAIVFFVLVAAWVGMAWWRARQRRAAVVDGSAPRAALGRPVLIALSLLALAGGVAATVSVIATGHNGARSVWDEPAK